MTDNQTTIRCQFCEQEFGGPGARGWLRLHIVFTHPPTRVECAALLTETGEVISLPRPARHHDVIQHMTRRGFSSEQIARSEQGFTTDTLDFVRRQPAKIIAAQARQLIRETHPRMLFSEDVW